MCDFTKFFLLFKINIFEEGGVKNFTKLNLSHVNFAIWMLRFQRAEICFWVGVAVYQNELQHFFRKIKHLLGYQKIKNRSTFHELKFVIENIANIFCIIRNYSHFIEHKTTQ